MSHEPSALSHEPGDMNHQACIKHQALWHCMLQIIVMSKYAERYLQRCALNVLIVLLSYIRSREFRCTLNLKRCVNCILKGSAGILDVTKNLDLGDSVWALGRVGDVSVLRWGCFGRCRNFLSVVAWEWLEEFHVSEIGGGEKL